MRAAYLSQLENILRLRCEYSDLELSKKSIKNINQKLLNDHIVNNKFSRIAEKRADEISAIENYSYSSLDDINSGFADQSDKLESIWNEYSAIKDYLTNDELFGGLAEKIKENEEKYHISRNIEEVNKHHELVIELSDERKTLDSIRAEIWLSRQMLDSLPIFKGIKLVDPFEKECRNAKESKHIKKLYTKRQVRGSLRRKMNDISNSWLEMRQYFYKTFNNAEYVNKCCDKDRADIIQKFFQLAELENREIGRIEIGEILIQLNRKRNYIKKIADKPYPGINYNSVSGFRDTVRNIFLFFINIFLITFILLFVYLARYLKILSGMKKSVLDW